MRREMLALALAGMLLGACGGSSALPSRQPSDGVAAPASPTVGPTTRASAGGSVVPTALPTPLPTPTSPPQVQVQAGATAYVDVAVAMGWRAPESVRDVDTLVLEDPVRIREWLAAMSDEEMGGLIGAADSQLLLGEPVEVVDLRDGWAQVVAPDQATPLDDRGYPLWIPMAQLTAVPPVASAQVATVVVPTTWLQSADGTRTVEVSFGTRLPVLVHEESRVEVALPDGSPMWVEADAVVTAATGANPLPATARAVVASARAFVGLPYLWAGTSGFGVDCSGLVYRVYEAHGVLLPRDADPQARVGTSVERDDLEPGDLVFFARDGSVHHVAMYIGDGEVLEAPYVGATVRVSRLSTLPYAPEYAGARRFLDQ